jgi:TRAP-type transport system periplasmic protein
MHRQTKPMGAAVSAAILIIAGALGASGAAAQTKSLRFGHLHAVDSPVHQGVMKAAEEVGKRTSGRYKIDIFPSSQLGAAREMVAQVVDGNLDFIIEGPGSLSALQRTMSIFEAPFVSRDWDHLLKMLETPFAKTQLKELEEKRNMVNLGAWYYGQRHFTTRNKALNSADDLKGMKIRVPEAPLFLDMIRALGATPTPMTLGEVYLSLQTGVTEGQENPLPTINNNKFFEVQKFINLTGHIIVPLMPMMNAKAWTAMSEADRQAFRQAFLEGAKVNDELTRKAESELLDQFKSKGMTVVNSDRNTFRSAMTSVYAKWEEVWGKGTFETMRDLK